MCHDYCYFLPRSWYTERVSKRPLPKPLKLRGDLPLEFDLYEVSGKWRLEGDRLHWEQAAEVAGPWPRKEDALELRRQFLAIERGNVQALFAFLKHTGLWMNYRKEFGLYEFWQDQDTIRWLLTRNLPPSAGYSFQEWFELGMGNFFRNCLDDRSPLDVQLRGKRLVASYVLAETRDAIFLSAWLDFARGARFRFCKRPDCPKHRPGTVPFELTSRHRRRYCSQYCAHLESMRRIRARQSSADKERKTRARPRGKRK